MARKTKIEWADATWNPMTGCIKVSSGCNNCYAETLANRLRGPAFPNGFAPTMKPHLLCEPLKRRDEAVTYFVNSLSDVFHREFPLPYVAAVFGVMAVALRHGHTFQVLTKRPERAARFLADVKSIYGTGHIVEECVGHALELMTREEKTPKHVLKTVEDFLRSAVLKAAWPLPNVWLGVSIENERVAEQRLNALRRCPAAVRFVSAEPLLDSLGDVDFSGIDWVIIGGESGNSARPMELYWVRDTIDAAKRAKAKVFVKQLGSVWATTMLATHPKGGDPSEWPADLRIREMPDG